MRDCLLNTQYNFMPCPCFLTQAKGKSVSVKTPASNPMRTRAVAGLKAKPMPATATTMVKQVWRSYFFGGMAARAAEAEAAQADKSECVRQCVMCV